jgi:hypothetical protein
MNVVAVRRAAGMSVRVRVLREGGKSHLPMRHAALETPIKKWEMPVCEWHTLADGKLIAGRVMLDVVVFRHHFKNGTHLLVKATFR